MISSIYKFESWATLSNLATPCTFWVLAYVRCSWASVASKRSQETFGLAKGWSHLWQVDVAQHLCLCNHDCKMVQGCARSGKFTLNFPDACPLPHSVVHPSPPTSLIACSPSPLNGPPTSPVLHTNPPQQGKSLVTFSVLSYTIWTWAVTLIPGCYDGLFVEQQAILDKVYKLASRGPQNFKLDIWGTSVGLSIPPLCSC